jgi:di/tricarboxylate transporter
MLAFIWWWLTRGGFQLSGHGSGELIRSELAELGPLSRGEKLVALIFVLTALAWVLQPLIGRIGSSEVAGIGMASVDHQVAINRVRPTAAQAVSDRPAGGLLSKQANNSSGPSSSPIQAALAGAGAAVVESAITGFLSVKKGCVIA